MKKSVLSILSASYLAFGMISIANATSLNVLVLNESRNGVMSNENGSINFNFKEGDGFEDIREKLLASFDISFLESASTLNPSTLNNAHVVILASATALSGVEKNYLGGFIDQGGGLIAFGNNSARDLGDIFGATHTTDGTSGAVVSNAASPIVKGIYGSFSQGKAFNTGFSYAFSDLGDGEAAMTNPEGYFAASFELGSGRAALFTDEEIFMNKTVSGIAAANLTEDSAKVFLNSFDFISENITVVPVPAAIWLLGSGLIGLAGMKRKSF